MALANSDAESSEGARPRFRPVRAPAGGRNRGRRRNFEDALMGALNGGLSSDEDGEAPAAARAAEGAADGEPRRGVTGDSGGDFVVHAEKAKPKKRKEKTEAASAGEPKSRRKGDAQEEAQPKGADELREEVKRKREIKAKQPAAPKQSFREQLEAAESAMQAAQAEASGAKRRGKVATRKEQPARSRVLDGITPEKEGKAQAHSPEEDAIRFHLRSGPGAKGAVGWPKGANDSGSEGEDEDGDVEAWRAALQTRVDPGGEGVRSAFSIKVCGASVIRRLDSNAFLGERSAQEGGKLLWDDEGKVNLHFLLATYKEVLRVRERQQKGIAVGDIGISGAERKHLRYLVRVAREERLVNSSELRRGKIAPRRMERILKSGRWSMALDANLAEESGAEQKGSPDVMTEEGPSLLDIKFPERQAMAQRNAAAIKRSLSSHIDVRQSEITTTASHDVDVDKARDILTAPKLSFDFVSPSKGLDDDDEDGLQVLADFGKNTQHETKRDLFRHELRRSVSFRQAKNLSKAPSRLPSSHSLDFEPFDAPAKAVSSANAAASTTKATPAPANSQEEAPSTAGAARAESVPDAPSQTPMEESQEQAGAAQEEPPALPQEAPEVAQTAPREESSETPQEDVDMAPDAPSASPATAPPGSRPLQVNLSEAFEDAAAAAFGTLPSPPCQKEAPDGASADLAPTQPMPESNEFAEISPTNLWGVSATPEPRTPASVQRPAQQASDLEITPTAPFVPKEVSIEAASSLEISPTVPFVPMPVQTSSGDSEISPTAPFVPKEVVRPAADVAISPTLPFIPKEVSAGACVDDFDISPTAPFVPKPVLPEAPASGAPAAPQAAEAAPGGAAGPQPLEAAPKASKRGLKREASLLSDDSGNEPSDAGAGSPDLATTGLLEGEEAQPETEADKRRRRQEQEWLRHKAKKQREEERQAKRRQVEMDRARKEEARGVGSAMSQEELRAFQAMLGGADASAASAVEKPAGGALSKSSLPKPSDEEEDDTSLLRGRRGNSRSQWFLLGNSAPMTAR